MTKPTPNQAEQAAGLLGIDVFYLGCALREEAAKRIEQQARRVRGLEDLETGLARRLLWGAEACDRAWEMVNEAAEETVTT